MSASVESTGPAAASRLDRTLSLFADVRAGEGATAVLMLVNVFLLLLCYSVIKTVREPLILLGGGAEVRSYAAAGQALLLMAFVPAYGLLASRVSRMKLIVGLTLGFVVCIELFAAAVSARVPFVGVAFFIWVGIFSISLVAQFWSFANDIYGKEAGARLFPLIMIGMTAGAPLGSLVAARLFRAGLPPQMILQLSAMLLTASAGLYVLVNRRISSRTSEPAPALDAAGGFALVLGNRYLRLLAALVVLLNIVNTTGEYVIARLLTAHVNDLAAATPGFDRQAFIGAYSGEYQFFVNITALLLQACVTSRLVKARGLQGALLALPLIALGGYAFIAAGVSFSVVRWIKTAENATDYSIMNTARQLLWLPTTREEKYKAKQAIDTFFVRAGDVLSAAVVFIGTGVLHLGPSQFAAVNVVLTVVWLGVALRLLRPEQTTRHISMPRLAGAGAAAAVLAGVLIAPAPAQAQETRAEQLAAAKAEKAAHLEPYAPGVLERRIDFVNRHLLTPRQFHPFVGSVLEGGGLAVGPGYRRPFGDGGLVTAHAAWTFRHYTGVEGRIALPAFGDGRVRVEAYGGRIHAPTAAFYGVGNGSQRGDRQSFGYDEKTVGASARVQAGRLVEFGGSSEYVATAGEVNDEGATGLVRSLDLAYARNSAFASLDSRTSPGYSQRGGLARVSLADYRQVNGAGSGFMRADGELQAFIPLRAERQIVALRAAAATTVTAGGNVVPFYLLPELGGNSSLRGYSSWRFRDRARLLLSGEYRWSAGPLVDMSLFGDAGQVAPQLRDLSLRNLHTSYGVGFSVHTPSATVTRLEVARSREGVGLLISFSPSF